MRDYEQVKQELVDAEAALQQAESGGGGADELRERAADLRREMYEHPQHPADTEGSVDPDNDQTYPPRTP